MKNLLFGLSVRKKLIYFSFLFVALLIAWSNFSVYYVNKDFLTSDLRSIPEQKVGLVLGTSRNLRNGSSNAYFFTRIEAAVQLFEAGKIQYVLVSGDNGTKSYNEPEDMRKELLARGIPNKKIFLDYAGFDTYDSIIRAWKIFGQRKFIVVSQHFHNQRAVYIGRRFGLEVYGYNTADVKIYGGFRTKVREAFACVKAYLEVKCNVQPTFLGKQIVMK